jgi:hypothetical protein
MTVGSHREERAESGVNVESGASGVIPNTKPRGC